MHYCALCQRTIIIIIIYGGLFQHFFFFAFILVEFLFCSFAIYFSKCNGIELVAIDDDSTKVVVVANLLMLLVLWTKQHEKIDIYFFLSIFQVFAIFPLRSRTNFVFFLLLSLSSVEWRDFEQRTWLAMKRVHLLYMCHCDAFRTIPEIRLVENIIVINIITAIRALFLKLLQWPWLSGWEWFDANLSACNWLQLKWLEMPNYIFIDVALQLLNLQRILSGFVNCDTHNFCEKQRYHVGLNCCCSLHFFFRCTKLFLAIILRTERAHK